MCKIGVNNKVNIKQLSVSDSMSVTPRPLEGIRFTKKSRRSTLKKCIGCRFTTTAFTELARHQIHFHPRHPTSITCLYCSDSMNSITHLVRHLRKCYFRRVMRQINQARFLSYNCIIYNL
jgi:hypothetical protein